jgi:uncharacterized ferritin-like protein (DUF455 family)
MVLEARGIDVTPTMIQKLRDAEDPVSANALQIIYNDEIGHVAVGRKWFEHLSHARSLDPVETWQHIVRTRFKGGIKPPINKEGREKAGFPDVYYDSLV